MAKNRVEKFFLSLADSIDIKENHGWRTKLVKKLGKKIGVDGVEQIYTWAHRNRLPKDWADNFQKLPFSDDIRKQCQECKEMTLRSENHPPGSKNSVSHIGEHSENYNKAVTELFSLIENPEMASKFAQGMVSVIKKDPERFYDKYYSGIIGDCDMLKGIQKNRRKHLRIMN